MPHKYLREQNPTQKFSIGDIVVIAVNKKRAEELKDPGKVGWNEEMSSEFGKKRKIVRVEKRNSCFIYLCDNYHWWNEHWLRKCNSDLTTFLNSV